MLLEIIASHKYEIEMHQGPFSVGSIQEVGCQTNRQKTMYTRKKTELQYCYMLVRRQKAVAAGPELRSHFIWLVAKGWGDAVQSLAPMVLFHSIGDVVCWPLMQKTLAWQRYTPLLSLIFLYACINIIFWIVK